MQWKATRKTYDKQESDLMDPNNALLDRGLLLCQRGSEFVASDNDNKLNYWIR